MDVFDKMKRSEIMAKVKQKNTGPEQVVGKFLFSKGFRYRKNVKSLPGSPDIVLVKYKTVIFVHVVFGMVIHVKLDICLVVIYSIGERRSKRI